MCYLIMLFHNQGTTEIYTLSLHDALPILLPDCDLIVGTEEEIMIASGADDCLGALKAIRALSSATIVLKRGDRKSTRLNSSHSSISYAVFCLKKKNQLTQQHNQLLLRAHH